MVAEQMAGEQPADLSVEQRNLQPVAYKNADGSRRASGRIFTSVERAKGNEQQAIHAKEYAVNLEVELHLQREGLLFSASTGEPREFCCEMKGDYHRFFVDVSIVSQRQAPTIQKERKTTEVPQIMTQEIVVLVTRPYPEYVDDPYANPIVVQTVEETVEVPRVQHSDRIIDLLVVMQVPVTQERILERIVEETDVPVPHVMEETIEVETLKSQRSKGESTLLAEWWLRR